MATSQTTRLERIHVQIKGCMCFCFYNQQVQITYGYDLCNGTIERFVARGEYVSFLCTCGVFGSQTDTLLITSIFLKKKYKLVKKFRN